MVIVITVKALFFRMLFCADCSTLEHLPRPNKHETIGRSSHCWCQEILSCFVHSKHVFAHKVRLSTDRYRKLQEDSIPLTSVVHVDHRNHSNPDPSLPWPEIKDLSEQDKIPLSLNILCIQHCYWVSICKQWSILPIELTLIKLRPPYIHLLTSPMFAITINRAHQNNALLRGPPWNCLILPNR